MTPPVHVDRALLTLRTVATPAVPHGYLVCRGPALAERRTTLRLMRHLRGQAWRPLSAQEN